LPPRSVRPARRLAVSFLLLFLFSSRPAQAQNRIFKTLTFLGGAVVGLAAHEGGHLLFDVAFDADPQIKSVSFAGIPFFAITHRPGLPRGQSFVIGSAGFWMQHATSELVLSRRPRLRDESAPLVKGWLAFNLAASAAYAGAAFARGGPAERDTRSMAEALRIGEPWAGVLVLTPAMLDGYRYLRPESAWARWASRAAKVGLVLLVARASD
jgi:hypothetical protein